MEISLKLNFPDMSEIDAFQAKMILAGELYYRKKLTLGQAAELVGISKRSYIETMGSYGYSVFGNDDDDILNDVRDA